MLPEKSQAFGRQIKDLLVVKAIGDDIADARTAAAVAAENQGPAFFHTKDPDIADIAFAAV
jgi:hypothetical protein